MSGMLKVRYNRDEGEAVVNISALKSNMDHRIDFFQALTDIGHSSIVARMRPLNSTIVVLLTPVNEVEAIMHACMKTGLYFVWHENPDEVGAYPLPVDLSERSPVRFTFLVYQDGNDQAPWCCLVKDIQMKLLPRLGRASSPEKALKVGLDVMRGWASGEPVYDLR